MSPEVAAALEERGIVTPFRIQALVLPDALAGLDVLAKAPTGSGKTFAFGLSIVERATPADGEPSVLVLVPTRELAAQVAGELALVAEPKRLRVAAVYGGAPLAAQAKRARGAHVLVATPGRLQDLVERRLVSLDRVRTLVLDEADRMLDMGFKPQVDRLVRRLPRERQTMLFSATLDGEVGELARAYTTSPSRFEASLPEEQASGRGRARLRVGHARGQARPADRGARDASEGSRSSSSGRSAAPTGSPASSTHATSRRSPSTGT